jgi:DNA-binding MarR family transcriptional regulator
MATNLLDQLIGLTRHDLELLKTLSYVGAATAEEVALKLKRPGDDLTPQIRELVQRKLVETRTMTVGDEVFEVYQVDPRVRKTLLS